MSLFFKKTRNNTVITDEGIKVKRNVVDDLAVLVCDLLVIALSVLGVLAIVNS